MSRPQIRTATVNLDVIQPIIDLFGTVQNAYDQLNLSVTDITYATFYRALHFRHITPEHKDQIEDAWTRWRYLFLRPELPVSEALQLTPVNRHEDPAWLARRARKAS